VIAHLQPLPVYVRVIDVGGLKEVRESDWAAIVVIHTWQMRKPPLDVQKFISRVGDTPKVIVLTTSGRGTFKMEGIDAISSASEMIDVPRRVAEIDTRIGTLLDRNASMSGNPAAR
ncbi:MAG TPA: hypothetical protein VI653_10375, partial [Steroidobacteraceae bacterium]